MFSQKAKMIVRNTELNTKKIAISQSKSLLALYASINKKQVLITWDSLLDGKTYGASGFNLLKKFSKGITGSNIVEMSILVT